MIAVDTNILARFYVDDPTDAEAARQRPIARRVVEHTETIHVPMTVVQELVWVLTGHYEFAAEECARVIEHLVGLPNVDVADAHRVMEAVRLYREGLDFADALHLALSEHCDVLLTFDDRKFARRAAKLGAATRVDVPRT